MSEQVFIDIFGEQIVLTDTVRKVILSKHPEASAFIDQLATVFSERCSLPRVGGATSFIDQLATVFSEPDEIRRSSTDSRVVLYYRYDSEVFGGKWLVAVVKRVDRNFVSTLYATSKIKAGELLWKK